VNRVFVSIDVFKQKHSADTTILRKRKAAGDCPRRFGNNKPLPLAFDQGGGTNSITERAAPEMGMFIT
jgi:hypothetical protein